jgi:hypothetical protein
MWAPYGAAELSGWMMGLEEGGAAALPHAQLGEGEGLGMGQSMNKVIGQGIGHGGLCDGVGEGFEGQWQQDGTKEISIPEERRVKLVAMKCELNQRRMWIQCQNAMPTKQGVYLRHETWVVW